MFGVELGEKCMNRVASFSCSYIQKKTKKNNILPHFFLIPLGCSYLVTLSLYFWHSILISHAFTHVCYSLSTLVPLFPRLFFFHACSTLPMRVSFFPRSILSFRVCSSLSEFVPLFPPLFLFPLLFASLRAVSSVLAYSFPVATMHLYKRSYLSVRLSIQTGAA